MVTKWAPTTQTLSMVAPSHPGSRKVLILDLQLAFFSLYLNLPFFSIFSSAVHDSA
jgi:hypothetical protein